MKYFYIFGGIFLGLIAVLVILSFTLFSLNSVSVEFETTSLVFDITDSEKDIVQTAALPEGACVFFMDKSEPTKRLEKAFPYLKVINIETVFPNKAIIHCAEREEVFSLQIENGKELILDESLKILKIQDAQISTQFNPIQLLDFQVLSSTTEVGEKITFGDDVDTAIKNFLPAMKLNNRTTAESKALIQSISYQSLPSINDFKDMPALVLKDFTNFFAKLSDACENLTFKISCYLEALSLLTAEQKESAYFYIYTNKDEKITAQLIKD